MFRPAVCLPVSVTSTIIHCVFRKGRQAKIVCSPLVIPTGARISGSILLRAIKIFYTNFLHLGLSVCSGGLRPSSNAIAFRRSVITAILPKMFIGHYSVAFAARSDRNKIPLWVLFIAVQFLDYIWATLVLLGIEKLHVIKGFTAGSMLDSYFHPYSHSLIMAILWSVVAALIYKTVCGRHGRHYTRSAPFIIGTAVFSHWLLDLIAHPRDLAIYDNTWKVGFGLWNYRGPEFALEIGLLAGGIAFYIARNTMLSIRKGAVIAFGILLVIIQIGDTYVPRAPLTDKATVIGVWIFYTLFVIIAFGVEKIGSRPKANAP